ncbi:MAG TPA: PEP-CTERM sorting domain-containing protein [Burkholderiales bacterium]|nr:PEP-CTERM sorting domain-containing protein [Burkholderiales bacterium]
MIKRSAIAAIVATLISALSSGTLYADPVAIPVDISANVIESILPGGTVFHDSKPLFGTTIDPIQSAELLHVSDTGVNASGRSTNISGAFASSLAESDGNGGVGVSQLIFGSPGGSGDGVRKLVAQSLWTHTFVYNGPAAHDMLHLNIPTLQVGLLGVPPRRSGPSATETAEAVARVDTVITHPDGSMLQGVFEFGLREFETQVPSGSDLLNLADKQILEQPNPLVFTPVLHFNGDDFNPSYTLDPVTLDLDLGVIQAGDTMSWVYTLTAQGTTHGFERGYFAFLGDPFGGDVITDNLRETIDPTVPATVPEASSLSLTLLGLAGLFLWRRRQETLATPAS